MTRSSLKKHVKDQNLDINIVLMLHQHANDVFEFLLKLSVLLDVELSHKSIEALQDPSGEKYIVASFSCSKQAISAYRKGEIMKHLFAAVEVIRFSGIVSDCYLTEASSRSNK